MHRVVYFNLRVVARNVKQELNKVLLYLSLHKRELSIDLLREKVPEAKTEIDTSEAASDLVGCETPRSRRVEELVLEFANLSGKKPHAKVT